MWKFRRAMSDYQTLALESPRQDSSRGLEMKRANIWGGDLTLNIHVGFCCVPTLLFSALFWGGTSVISSSPSSLLSAAALIGGSSIKQGPAESASLV